MATVVHLAQELIAYNNVHLNALQIDKITPASKQLLMLGMSGSRKTIMKPHLHATIYIHNYTALALQY